MGHTQPHIQWTLEALSMGIKWPGHKINHSPTSNDKVKNAWSYISTIPYVFMAYMDSKFTLPGMKQTKKER
jgi:hypothetical protein